MAFQIRKEYSTALIFILALLIFIWGFKFLKGINLLSSNKTYLVKYKSVDQLRPSSPIFINGLEVGSVTKMYVDPVDDNTIIAELNVPGSIEIPKSTIATIIGLSAMGGKAVELVIPGPCSGNDCAQDGDFLVGRTKSFIQSVVGGPEEFDPYTDKLKYALTTAYDSITDPNDPKGIGRMLLSLDETSRQLEIMTKQLNAVVLANKASIQATTANAASISSNINANNSSITATIKSLEELTNQLKEANLKGTVAGANGAIDTATIALKSVTSTLAELKSNLQRTDALIARLNTGEGSAGKILTDEALYENLTRSLRHLNLLLQDLRLNPKRYNTVKLKVFGKNKQPDYKNPIDDPAYQMLIDSLERAYLKNQSGG